MKARSKYGLIWEQMEGERIRYGAAAVSLILASCFLYLVPLVPRIVLDGVLAEDGSEPSGYVHEALQLAGGEEFLAANLWIALIAIVLLTAIAGLFTYLRGRWAGLAAERIARRLRDRLHDHLHHLPCRYYDTADTGDLVQRCTSDVETFRLFLSTQLVEIGRAVVMMALPLPLMLAIDARMTLVSVALIPIIIGFSVVFFRGVQKSFKAVDEAEAEMTSTLQENLGGIRVVRAFARQEFEEEKFAKKVRAHRGRDAHLYRLMGVYWSLSDLVCMSQVGLVIGFGSYWMSRGDLPVGTFYFFLATANLFIWPVRMMGRTLTELGKALVAIGRIYEILAEAREQDSVQTSVPGFKGALSFENVAFSHGASAVLHEISFDAAAGETVALVGPSGSGKSTIVNLLLRFYEPESSRIRLDGHDLSSLPLAEVRSAIAVVMQEPFLYSKSLRDNIRFGRPDAHPDEIVEAAEAAHVHGSIEAFESGYETMVGERGVMLSGGQRQRVALARALLDRPALLVLDDALSAVDTETESLILENLRARQGNQTTILIAHRISTLMHADRILVLDRGRIVERGTHEELIAGHGLYRRLWEIQTNLEEDLVRDLEHAGGDGPSGAASPQSSARPAKPGTAYPEDESAQDASSTVAV